MIRVSSCYAESVYMADICEQSSYREINLEKMMVMGIDFESECKCYYPMTRP